jgi:hypothetical protein
MSMCHRWGEVEAARTLRVDSGRVEPGSSAWNAPYGFLLMAGTSLTRSPLHPASWDTQTSDDGSGTRHLPLMMASNRVPQVPA